MTDIANNMGQIIEAHNFGSKKKKKENIWLICQHIYLQK